MKFFILYLALIGSAISATNQSWKPKYELKKLKSLKAKIKPTQAKKSKAKVVKKYKTDTPLEKLFLHNSKKKSYLSKLKSESMKLKQKAVPTLIKVMKNSYFPEQSRWIATYMLGKIMGKKSAPFISKFTSHPSWMMRLASLKVLLHLQQKQYDGIYARMLEDKSLIVRHQALQNIRELKLSKLAPYVWKMLYNKKNYVGLKGKRKRSNIIKDAIKVVGELGLKEAKTPMLKMFQKNKYKDVFPEIDYSLSKLFKKSSPDGNLSIKRNYWKKIAMSNITI